jgi:hypothetical protein
MDNKDDIRMINEQGDMGLWDTPLSDEDQKKYNKDKEKEQSDK